MNPTLDLNDPVQLATQLETMAAGLRAQAESSRQGSGMSGHPHPEFLFAQAERVMLAAAKFVRVHAPSPPPSPPVESAPATEPTTAGQGAQDGVTIGTEPGPGADSGPGRPTVLPAKKK